MRSRRLSNRRLLAANLVLGLVAAGSATTANPASGAASERQLHATGSASAATVNRPPKILTLVTGDKVTVTDLSSGGKGLSITPSADRPHGARFYRQTIHGDTYLIPTEVAPLVAANRIDRRLFNLSRLIRDGNDDASRDSLPLIVTYPAAATYARQAIVDGAGTVTRALPSAHGLAVTQRKAGASRLWRTLTAQTTRSGHPVTTLAAGIDKIWLDGRVKASLDRSVPQIGAPAAWQAGYTGKGVKVAILDTGIDREHPDLANAVIEAKDFAGSASGTADRNGHGTHVASTVAGSGAALNGKYKGVAPDAKLLIGKVLDDNGVGGESEVIAAMEWAAAQGAKVANLSLGGYDDPEIDPMEMAVNDITARSGLLFVIAAGNSGELGDESIATPGSAAAALTVGAVDRQDQVTPWSSRGPNQGDVTLKPDVTAPGLGIVAARAKDTEGEPGDQFYTAKSGTSMATPHVTGSVALLAQQHPDWKPEALKNALINSAKATDGARVFDQGGGRVDLARAITEVVHTTVPNADFGLVRYPHNVTATRTVTYRNEGTAPVTFDAALTATGPDGKAVTDVFALSASQVTVPAGGTADLGVTLTATSKTAGGAYSGYATATSTDGRTVVRTPVGMNVEHESYDVTIRLIDRKGHLAPGGVQLAYARQDQFGWKQYIDMADNTKLRLPKGTYNFGAVIATPRDLPTQDSFTLAGQPDVAVDKELTLTFDARQGRRVAVATEHPGLTQRVPSLGLTLASKFQPQVENGVVLADSDTNWNPLYAVPSIRPAKDPESYSYNYTDTRVGNVGRATLKMKVTDYTVGRIPATLSHLVKDADLGGTTEQIYGQGPQPTVAERRDYALLPWSVDTFDAPAPVWAPGTMTLLASPVPGGTLSHMLAFELKDGSSAQLRLDNDTVRKGERKTLLWNQAVDGPAFGARPVYRFTREGDELGGYVRLHGDAAGHEYMPSATDDHAEAVTYTLYRDGVLLDTTKTADAARFEVPPSETNYRLVVSATRTVPWSALSSTVECEFSFRSSHVADGDTVVTPLSVLRYRPRLDTSNRAAAGTSLAVPVSVQRQPDAKDAAVRSLAVEASFDDGRTWTAVPIRAQGTNWLATVTHPALGQTNGYVALRGNFSDADGNMTKQTILRAYKLR